MRRTIGWACLVLAAGVITGCALTVREGYFGCHDDSECPPHWSCRVDRCYSTPGTTDASIDASVDASADAGRDVGTDGSIAPGVDSGIDAATDVDAGDTGTTDLRDAATSPDSGADAGDDAGHDAGSDAGHDAGHDASTWSPSGTFGVSPAHSLMCAEYDLNVTMWTFVDDGSVLRVSDPNLDVACTLVGGTARTTGSFDVSCTVSMACSAAYHLTGTFTSDNTWSGSFSVTFTGVGTACGTIPDTCVSRSWSPVTGSR